MVIGNYTSDKGRKEQYHLSIEIRLNARTILSYWVDNYDPIMHRIEWNEVPYHNFLDYLTAVIYKEFYDNFNRLLRVGGPSGTIDEVEIELDTSVPMFDILRVIEKNNIWDRYVASHSGHLSDLEK